MSDPVPSDRHLTAEGLEHYIVAGAPAVVKIDGTPVAYLVIEPAEQKLCLRTPLARHALPDLSAYQHISAATVYWNDATWCELRIDGGRARHAYPMLCSIADRIQYDGADFKSAVLDALTAYRELLSGHARLSFEEEIGLFGELLVLRHLFGHFAPSRTIAFWRGPEKEEHDFDVEGHDIEVKSTVSEERLHWINDVNQLQPALDRPLWLVSIQLTGAGDDGLSLQDLIADIRALLPIDADNEAFGRKVREAKWRDETAQLYPRKWRLRSDPAVLAIDSNFPALTPNRLIDAGLDLTRFVQIRYVLNLGGLVSAAHAPVFLRNLCI